METKYIIGRIIPTMEHNYPSMYIDDQGHLILLKAVPLIRTLPISGNLETLMIKELNSQARIGNNQLIKLLRHFITIHFSDSKLRAYLLQLAIKSS